MSPRGISRHSVHDYRERLKAWLIAFYFDRFRAHSGPVILFAEKLPMGCDTTYNASRVFLTIWIVPECHQTTHLWFCGVTTKWPRNGRKSSNVCSKSWKFLIYHPMSPRVGVCTNRSGPKFGPDRTGDSSPRSVEYHDSDPPAIRSKPVGPKFLLF